MKRYVILPPGTKYLTVSASSPLAAARKANRNECVTQEATWRPVVLTEGEIGRQYGWGDLQGGKS